MNADLPERITTPEFEHILHALGTVAVSSRIILVDDFRMLFGDMLLFGCISKGYLEKTKDDRILVTDAGLNALADQ